MRGLVSLPRKARHCDASHVIHVAVDAVPRPCLKAVLKAVLSEMLQVRPAAVLPATPNGRSESPCERPCACPGRPLASLGQSVAEGMDGPGG